MTNFFQGGILPKILNPEAPGMDVMRKMLMDRAIQQNANPYGINPNATGANPLNPYAGHGSFNAYTGSYNPTRGGGVPKGSSMGLQANSGGSSSSGGSSGKSGIPLQAFQALLDHLASGATRGTKTVAPRGDTSAAPTDPPDEGPPPAPPKYFPKGGGSGGDHMLQQKYDGAPTVAVGGGGGAVSPWGSNPGSWSTAGQFTPYGSGSGSGSSSGSGAATSSASAPPPPPAAGQSGAGVMPQRAQSGEFGFRGYDGAKDPGTIERLKMFIAHLLTQMGAGNAEAKPTPVPTPRNPLTRKGADTQTQQELARAIEEDRGGPAPEPPEPTPTPKRSYDGNDLGNGSLRSYSASSHPIHAPMQGMGAPDKLHLKPRTKGFLKNLPSSARRGQIQAYRTDTGHGTVYDATTDLTGATDPTAGGTSPTGGQTAGAPMYPWLMPYEGKRTAGMSGAESQALGSMQDYGAGGFGLGQTSDYLSNEVGGGYIGAANPYMSSIQDNLQKIKDYQDAQAHRKLASAYSAGGNALSGARMQADSDYDVQSGAQFGNTIGQMQLTNLQKERELQQQGAGQQMQLSSQQMSNLGQLMGAGAVPRGIEQSEYDKQYNDWMRQTTAMKNQSQYSDQLANEVLKSGPGSYQPLYQDSEASALLAALGGTGVTGALGDFLKKLLGGDSSSKPGGGSSGGGSSGGGTAGRDASGKTPTDPGYDPKSDPGSSEYAGPNSAPPSDTDQYGNRPGDPGYDPTTDPSSDEFTGSAPGSEFDTIPEDFNPWGDTSSSDYTGSGDDWSGWEGQD